MPSLYRISSLGHPPLLGVPGPSLTWLSHLCSTCLLRNRRSPGLLTPSCSPVTADLPCCSPESVLLGSPFDVYITMLDAPSLLLPRCWMRHLSCTLPGNYITLLNSPVSSLLDC